MIVRAHVRIPTGAHICVPLSRLDALLERGAVELGNRRHIGAGCRPKPRRHKGAGVPSPRRRRSS